MRRRSLAPALLFALTPLLAACEDNGPEFPTLTGSWEGTSNDVTLSMSVFEDEAGSVVGNGALSSTTTAFPFDLTGGHSFPVVQLQLALRSEPDVLIVDGFVTFDSLSTLISLDASVTGGGFDRFPIQLTRK